MRRFSETLNIMRYSSVLLLLLVTEAFSAQAPSGELLLPVPKHGFISRLPASKWEESMLAGNGTTGALVYGNPLNERVILSHEKLFMPEYPPYPAPPLHKYLKQMREATLKGRGDKAAELLVRAGEEVGIDDMIWTDALIPACQLEIRSLSSKKVTEYTRSVNYETGEAFTAWSTGQDAFQRSIFFSRADQIGVMRISGAKPSSLNLDFRLAQLPRHEEDGEDDEEEGPEVDELIAELDHGATLNGLHYSTVFRKRWEGSLKGYQVEARIRASGGSTHQEGHWLKVRGADEILILLDIGLSYALPLSPVLRIERHARKSYEDLLESHTELHTGMFKRFSLCIGDGKKSSQTAEDLVNASSFGKLQPELVNQLCEASRYILISSTGQIPPTLQGIWGGTWRPAWSSDFTLNGNVPSVIACGLNTNLRELTEAYLDMMWSWFDDFRDSARDLYKAPGIFVPSRASSSGKTYHYGGHYPHLLWYAGNAWTSQFFYDTWQYTGDEGFLKERAIPFMLASVEFYEFILSKDNDGKYTFLPSYSPEVGPRGRHPLAINATMDVAALKQLLRNLLTLVDQGRIKTDKADQWKDILDNLPAYVVDEQGDLKEWIWPGLDNNNQHRHASHLYPLFYEVDPEFEKDPQLIQAAKTAIENRMKYRRQKNGAEMAFGLVQKGLAAAHIKDTDHAYECVDWLCNSYWSPALTAYHDPGEIFNVDICGGLPAVVTEMLVQSSAHAVDLLPALPKAWPQGKITGVRTRCGVTVGLEWKDHKPVRVTVKADRKTQFTLTYKEKKRSLQLEQGQVYNPDSGI